MPWYDETPGDNLPGADDGFGGFDDLFGGDMFGGVPIPSITGGAGGDAAPSGASSNPVMNSPFIVGGSGTSQAVQSLTPIILVGIIAFLMLRTK